MSNINFFCNLAEARTPLPHFWEHTVGSDHAPVALRADWQRQLQRSHDELGFRYVRFHGLLSDDLGTLVQDTNKLLYSFFNADQIFDFLLSIGMKPFVELSFMPKALASGKFGLLHDLGSEQLLVGGLHETADCSVILKASTLTILLTNHATPGHSIETEQIQVRLDNAPKPLEAYTQRIDAAHANPKALWQEMGQPEYLTDRDVEQLQEASRLMKDRQSWSYQDGAIILKTDLSPHAVAAITILFEPQERVEQ